MFYIDAKYARLLSNRLELFNIVEDHERFTATFRCPICGDSKKNPNKRRGYIFTSPNADSLIYKCHNCGYTTSFAHFLRDIDRSLYQQYTLEKLKKKTPPKKLDVMKAPKPKVVTIEGLESLLGLPDNHMAVQYAHGRKIPKSQWHGLYYTDNFRSWVNKRLPGKFKSVSEDPRLVMPFWKPDRSGIFMAQGRSMDTNEPRARYLTVRFDDSVEAHFFGLETIDKNKDIFVTEGPIDSLFLDNAVAMATSHCDVSKFFDKDKVVIVLDNEPRNPEIVKHYKYYADRGYRLVVWPTKIYEKDINDMVIAGHDVNSIVNKNIFQGIKAKLEVAKWKKI